VAARMHRLVSPAQKARLRHVVEKVERETGAEIAALVVPHADDIETLATAYFNHMGIGKRGHDNGVLIMVAVSPRRVRIEVGGGLEATVTPEAARRIIAEIMAPEFRRGRFGEGLIGGVEAVGRLIAPTGLA
jgi:uncharacterized protein